MTTKMTKMTTTMTGRAALLLPFALLGTGCLPTYEPTPAQSAVPEDNAPGRDTTRVSGAAPAVRPTTPSEATPVWIDHGDPALAAATPTGPLEVTSRQHACMKMRFDTLGRLLMNRGVTFPAVTGYNGLPVTLATDCTKAQVGTGAQLTQTAQPAAQVYCVGRLTLGLPLDSKTPEVTSPTTASATKLMDVLLASAADIIQKMPTQPSCLDASNQPATLFNVDNSCNEAGLTCLQGYPATEDQVALCTQIVKEADITPANATLGTPLISALETGRRLAVAAVMAAAHGCE